MRRAAVQVRGYKEHQCRFIFRLADVDLGQLGHVFGLLRMPRMAEIKHAAVALKNFRPSPVDPDTVKASTKAIMSARPVFSARALCPSAASVWHYSRNLMSLADCMQFLDKAREKQRQKSIKQALATAVPRPAALDRQHAKAGKQLPEQQARLPAAKRRLLDGRQDAAELADEYALLRKLKKGKLSEVKGPYVFILHASIPEPLVPVLMMLRTYSD